MILRVALLFGYDDFFGLASSVGQSSLLGGGDRRAVDGGGGGGGGDDDGFNDVLRGLLAERRRTLRRTKSSSSRDDIDGEGGGGGSNDDDDDDGDDEDDDDDYDDDYDEEYLRVGASPGLTTLLDDALYRAYEAELIPTVSAASRLIGEFVEMKEASALVLRECRWAVGVPLGGEMFLRRIELGDMEIEEVAAGDAVLGGAYVGEGAIVDEDGAPVVDFVGDEDDEDDDDDRGRGDGLPPDVGVGTAEYAEGRHAEDIANWNEYETIQDFAMHCYLTSREAIQRLTTDRLAETANRTLRDSIIASESESTTTNSNAGGSTQKEVVVAGGTLPSSHSSPQSTVPSSQQQLHAGLPLPPPSSSSSFPSPADAGIGRCYSPQPRRDCWESPRLYCPDYSWAEDAICGCQRLLRSLSKHRFLTLVSAHGWERYCGGGGGGSIKSRMPTKGARDRKRRGGSGRHAKVMHPPTYASDSPHVFPSLEAVHSLQFLVMELLASSIPARLNQFRAATESNAVVSKRLYLVKCEYRAPLRALWESCNNLNAAPRIALVERYLRDYHGLKVREGGSEGVVVAAGGGGGEIGGADGGGGTGLGGSRKKGGPSSTEVAKKTAIQLQIEKLEVSATLFSFSRTQHSLS